ncbi:MAG: hypothetical protein ACP5TY_03195 [Thermodesulforhabdaceae bacterium]
MKTIERSVRPGKVYRGSVLVKKAGLKERINGGRQKPHISPSGTGVKQDPRPFENWVTVYFCVIASRSEAKQSIIVLSRVITFYEIATAAFQQARNDTKIINTFSRCALFEQVYQYPGGR